MQTNELKQVLKCYLQMMLLQITYNIYKENLTLDNLQWLIGHKTEPNPTKLETI